MDSTYDTIKIELAATIPQNPRGDRPIVLSASVASKLAQEMIAIGKEPALFVIKGISPAIKAYERIGF